MDSLKSRNRLKRKFDWIQNKQQIVKTTKKDLVSCLTMIKGLLNVIDEWEI